VAGLTGGGWSGQILVTSIAALILVPVFVRWYRRFAHPVRKGLAGEGGMVGFETEVLEYGGRLGVRYQGDFFPAKRTDGQPLVPGMRVRVCSMKGITASVETQ
jgi:membrane protein implicated in regulation of membrane protease activity